MTAKHAKAKKCMIEEVMIISKCEMCCKTTNHIRYNYNQKPYSCNDFFYSRFAIQKRINLLVGRYYPIEKFCEEWNAIYRYLTNHTVTETKQHFGGIISVI